MKELSNILKATGRERLILATDKRPGTDYICATCYNIIATFETVTPEEFRSAAQDIEDPQLKELLKA